MQNPSPSTMTMVRPNISLPSQIDVSSIPDPHHMSSLLKRDTLLQDLPINICSYTCSFDVLNGLDGLNRLKIQLSDAPDLLPALRRRAPPKARYSLALTTTQALIQSKNNVLLAQQEDPWIILLSLRHFLNEFVTGPPILPICEALCTCGNTVTFLGDLEYIKEKFRTKMKLKKKVCPLCGQDMVCSPAYLP